MFIKSNPFIDRFGEDSENYELGITNYEIVQFRYGWHAVHSQFVIFTIFAGNLVP